MKLSELIAELEKLRPVDYDYEDRDIYFLHRGEDEAVTAVINKIEEIVGDDDIVTRDQVMNWFVYYNKGSCNDGDHENGLEWFDSGTAAEKRVDELKNRHYFNDFDTVLIGKGRLCG